MMVNRFLYCFRLLKLSTSPHFSPALPRPFIYNLILSLRFNTHFIGEMLVKYRDLLVVCILIVDYKIIKRLVVFAMGKSHGTTLKGPNGANETVDMKRFMFRALHQY